MYTTKPLKKKNKATIEQENKVFSEAKKFRYGTS